MSLQSLTDDQKRVFDEFVKFIHSNESVFVVCGSAGVGKSHITKYFANYLADNYKLCGVAPTHKAKHILNQMLNNRRIKPITTYTLSSLLGKIKDHSYIGTHKFTHGDDKKMSQYDFFILDEVSMVADKDLKILLSYVMNNNKKIILIGDRCQLPSPSQAIIKVNRNECRKQESMAFSDQFQMCELTEIVRQAKESPIIELATFIRDNMTKDIDLPSSLTIKSISIDKFATEYLEYTKQYPHTTRCIAYTNASVYEFNKRVRSLMGYNEKYHKGEMLTAYTSIGFPCAIITNGSDYIIKESTIVDNYVISGYKCYGHLLKLKVLETSEETPELFFIHIDKEQNFDIINKVIEYAIKVNSRYSTKDDYKKYKTLKDRILICEDVYKYNNAVLSFRDFKEMHPLLFTKTTDVIEQLSLSIKENTLTEKIKSVYPTLIQDRLDDVETKALDDSETLADMFKVIEKDMDYGYAITSHKSQGSTYDVVFVDYDDFNKIQNRFNWRFKLTENRTREKNQLKYVACTRARNKLFIISGNAEDTEDTKDAEDAEDAEDAIDS